MAPPNSERPVQQMKPKALAAVIEPKRRRTYSEADIKAADLKATERERERLSIELHDGLGQHLTGIAFLAKALANRLKAQSVPEETDAAQIAELTNQAISNIRALARGLQPVASEDNALSVALTQLALDTSRIYGADCIYNADKMILVSNQFVAHHLYRIAQEAVHNALKHGQEGSISIDFTENEKSLTLAITNFGQLKPAVSGHKPTPAGLGIASMRYRAKLLNARLLLENVGQNKVRIKLLISKNIAQSKSEGME